MTSFTDQWAQSGRSLRIQLLHFERSAVCPAPFGGMLGLNAGDRAARIERFRLSGALRVAWDRRYISDGIAKHIPRREFSRVSLLDVLATQVELDHAEVLLEAGLAGDEHAERLELLPHEPVLVRHMTYFSTDGKPVMAGVSVYRADQVRYKLTAPMRGPSADLNPQVRMTGLVN